MARKRAQNQRHYTSEEWVEFILDGVAESEGVDPDDVVVTDALNEEVGRFHDDALDAVNECTKKFPPTEYIEVDHEAAYLIYQTLGGAGVGIWDGSWDHYYPDYKQADWDRLTACLEAKLGKYVDVASGGSLDEAFREAVWESQNARGKTTKTKRDKSVSQLKNKLLR